MKSVFVTGATGFCGSHLCRLLEERGYAVTGATHRIRSDRTSYPYPLVPIDIKEASRTDCTILSLQPDVVCHLAAQSVPRFSWDSQEETFAVNTGGSVNLLNAIRKYSPKTVLLYASTIRVYGLRFHSRTPVKENDLLWPSDPYSASKVLSEFACLDFANRFGLRVIITRAFNHLGPGQPIYDAFSDWCRQIVLAEYGFGKPVLQVGNLRHELDVLHVRDVVRAYEILIRKGRIGHIYNISSGRAYALGEFVDFLLSQSRIPIRVAVDPMRVRNPVPPVMRADASRLMALGWRPEISPFTAIGELLTEWRGKIEKESRNHG
ncbi:MAG: GDP-mannose 4,6-dehydratase [Candidatus Omnitrophica bacterium]|nr:GDP-mannose 4,6-dehydratase [Candidatus Omnitrophota bacterium]